MHEKTFHHYSFLLSLRAHQYVKLLFRHIFLINGFIDPKVRECSPPRTIGNLLFDIIS